MNGNTPTYLELVTELKCRIEAGEIVGFGTCNAEDRQLLENPRYGAFSECDEMAPWQAALSCGEDQRPAPPRLVL